MSAHSKIIVLAVAAILVGCGSGKRIDGNTDTGTDVPDDTGLEMDSAPDTEPDTAIDTAGDVEDEDIEDATEDPDVFDIVEEEPGPDPLLTDDDGDGFSEWDGDCNDDDDQIFPGAINHIEGVDYDCDSRREYLAKMMVAVDDACELCINGTIIGSCNADGFRTSAYYETIMESGLNAVGVRGWDISAVTAAFGMFIEVAGTEIVTRGNRAAEPDTALWRYFPTTSADPQATWCEQSFDASSWTPAVFTAEMTDGAWLAEPTEQNRLGVSWVWDGNPSGLLNSWFRADIMLPNVAPVWDAGTTPVCTQGTAQMVSDPVRRLYNGVDVVWNGSQWVTFYDMWIRAWRYGCDDDMSRLLEADGTPAAAEVNINDQGGGTGGAVWWNTWPDAVWTGSNIGVVFEDGRHDRNGDILYGHMVDSAGNPIGAADTRLESTTSSQKYPDVAFSGSEFGIVWQDARDGGYEIYFRRASDAMAPVGTATRLTNALGTSRVPHVAWSGSEYGVVWEDNRDGGDYEIWFARVAADGTKVGTEVALTAFAGQSLDPRIVWSGSEWGVVWQDDGWLNAEIAFMRVDGDGAALTAPIRVTQDSHVSVSPDMVWAGSRYAIVWRDTRTSYSDIWMALVDGDGAKIGADEAVTSTRGWSGHPAVAWSGSELGVIWMEEEDPAAVDYHPWYLDAWFVTVSCP
jgi:hypothetical protein